MGRTFMGTVSRVVPEDARTNTPPRVFFQPEIPEDLRKVDGSKRSGAGEVIVTVEEDELADYELGARVEFHPPSHTMRPAQAEQPRTSPTAERLGAPVVETRGRPLPPPVGEGVLPPAASAAQGEERPRFGGEEGPHHEGSNGGEG